MTTVVRLPGLNDPPVTQETANGRAAALLGELSAGPFHTQEEVERSSAAFMKRVVAAAPFLSGVQVVEILPLPVPSSLPEGLHARYERRLSDLFRRHVVTRGMCSRRMGRKVRNATRRFYRALARELTPAHRPFLDRFPRTPRGADRMLSWLDHHDYFWRQGKRAPFDAAIQMGAWESAGAHAVVRRRLYQKHTSRDLVVVVPSGLHRWAVSRQGAFVTLLKEGPLYFPSASAALRFVDEALLRAGFNLCGDVHASPLTPGYRQALQGHVRFAEG